MFGNDLQSFHEDVLFGEVVQQVEGDYDIDSVPNT